MECVYLSLQMETEQVMTETAQSLQFEPTLPNGVDEKEKENAKEKSSTVVQDDLSAIEDEEVLDKMVCFHYKKNMMYS